MRVISSSLAIMGLAASVGLAATTAAQAGPLAADVVFLVDESGSMGGEHAFLKDVIDDLDSALGAEGITARKYGVVGFGRSTAGGAAHDVSGGLTDLATAKTSLNSLVTYGGFEDGYDAIDYAIDNFTFSGGAVNFILVTDEDRDILDGSLNYANILADMQGVGAVLNAVVNTNLRDGASTSALGIDHEGNAYIADGLGGFMETAGGNAVSGAGSTVSDYVNLALATDGAAWDLNKLRAGGSTAESFTAAFIDIKVEEVTEAAITASVSAPSGLAVVGAGMVGIALAARARRA